MIDNDKYKHFRVCRDDRDAVTVWLSHASRSMNVFDDEVLTELESIVQSLEQDHDAQVVAFRSGKDSGFLAGADVKKIAEVTPGEVEAVLRKGQDLFERIEELSIPTVAVIHGPCLGGGLEFALACDHRIASAGSSTRLGLPEVQLGVIPGWGGTQRLPKCVGLTNSLPMILQGKKLPASKALKIGLVDAIVEDSDWKLGVDRFVHTLIENPSRCRTAKKRSLIDRFLNETFVGRLLVFRAARKRTVRESANYPAIPAALRAIAAGFAGDEDGYLIERLEFADLIETPTCRNLLDLFFRRERARSPDTWRKLSGEDSTDLHIQKIGVIGAGAMGAGIGQLAAQKGLGVVLKEINDDLAEQGLQRVEDSLTGLVRAKRLAADDRDAILKRVSSTSDWQMMNDVDLVVEAAVERGDVKRQIFKDLNRHTKPSALLASNTSSLSVKMMADASGRSSQVGGLHFFNPVHRMDLVEVVKAPQTSDAVIADLVRFVKSLGKTPVVTSDSPGFLVNRVLFPYVGEAVHMVCEGVAAKFIDREARRFGMPMGPLELLDHVGIDVAYHVSGTLESVLKENEPVVALLGKMVAKGMTGVKGGTGFYHHANKKHATPTDLSSWIAASGSSMQPSLEFSRDGMTSIQRRLVYPLINESVRCLEEGVVQQAWMIDLAMVLGTGFAPFRGGPLTLAESIGWSNVSMNLQGLKVLHGERFQPAKLIRQIIDQDLSIYDWQDGSGSTIPLEGLATESETGPSLTN